MVQKKALTAAFAGLVAASLIAGVLLGAVPGPAPGKEVPPLAGDFAVNLTRLDPPVPAPQEAFQDLAGGSVRMADFAGQVVLLNFWATWCPPCVREMPSLDRLQAELGEDGLTIVAVSLDRGVGVIEPFAAKLGLKNLALYWDAKSTMARAFRVTGLPITFVVDAQGRIVGALQGAAEWDSPEALALIRHYLAARQGSDKQSAARDQRVGTGVSPE